MAETLIENHQEADYSYELEEEEDIDLSLLRLNSFGSSSSDRRRSNSSPPKFHSSGGSLSSSPYAAVSVGSPGKRPSPESKDSDGPLRKKHFLRPAEDDANPNLQGYTKISLPIDLSPNRTRSPLLFRRSLSDSFASSGHARPVAQEASPSGNVAPPLPPRPPLFRRSVSDITPAPAKTFRGSSSSVAIPEADLGKMGTSEADKMLLVIKDGAQELDQWCNKLLRYRQAASSSEKQNDDPKGADETEELRCEEFKEGVKVDRVGEAFVVEINCPCSKSYRVLFSGRDCYYKLL
ncbi:PREDICTED: uncharacterized protein LOC104826159 [Tarenaya hassleriana]|uniref:uncharacterized protein LOC104826159 n=1 Tax=Tarenaya hassleriana TaxID=28532 RepID=UPI00053C0D36|nr:PREDICTED: uncharacterized protein LOC104826159 [Tarenaya hassleriana]